jgi:hypothetical protein
MKYKPYKMPASQALPDVKIPEPGISAFAFFLIRLVGRLYLFLAFGVGRTVMGGGAGELYRAFKRHLEGKSHVIVAFRHSIGAEPQILSLFFMLKLRRLAAKAGVRFPRFPHAVFVYGYEVVRWGGAMARFIMPRLGAMPVHHAKLDRDGMARIFDAITQGPYPLALAPEGQVSYSNDTVPRLEQGVIRIGFNAAERLAKGGSAAPVEVLPLSFHCAYGRAGRRGMEKLLRETERLTGKEGGGKLWTLRVAAVREAILQANEKRYGIEPEGGASFASRLMRVISCALMTTERLLGESSPGEPRSDEEIFSRMYNLRQICWDRMILPDVETFEETPPVERSLLDLRAGEAWHASRHLEIVDFSWYFKGDAPGEGAPLRLQVEYVQNLWDFANRTRGGQYADRKNIRSREVIIEAAPAINLSAMLEDYRKDRKAVGAAALQTLYDRFIENIGRVNRAS